MSGLVDYHASTAVATRASMESEGVTSTVRAESGADHTSIVPEPGAPGTTSRSHVSGSAMVSVWGRLKRLG